MRIPIRSLGVIVGLVSSLWLTGCDGSTEPANPPVKVTAAMSLIYTGPVALDITPATEPRPFNLRLDVTIKNIGWHAIEIYDHACATRLELFADAAHQESSWTSPDILCLLGLKKQRIATGEQVVWTSSYSTVPPGTYFGIVTTGVGNEMMSIDAGSITLP